MNRRGFLRSLGGAVLGSSAWSVRGQPAPPPNVLVILADDLGYGDLGVYGSQIPTPNLDRMASEGMRFEQCYAASSTCTPSRAALLTGRYPARVGLPGVLMPDARKGIPESERTFAQLLQASGYRTTCIGKWHLGMAEGFAPRAKGFDEFYGVPYSNDMNPLPMMWNEEVVNAEADNSLLTRRYTERAVGFIEENRERPFLMYLAHNAPHIPLGVSREFRKKTGMGKYGDVVAELDWGVGEVMNALSRNGLDENTLVLFTSDNGPWYQGSAGRLRGRKGETYDGGTRVPFIARMAGRIPAGAVNQGLTSLMDVMPTVSTLTGCGLPEQRLDGADLTPVLMGEREAVDRGMLLFFDGWNAQCAREGNWKLHMSRYNTPPWLRKMGVERENLPLCHPELYDIEKDPGENYDRAEGNPDVVEAMVANMDALVREFPQEVVTAWDDTRRKSVWTQPEGAMPVAGTP